MRRYCLLIASFTAFSMAADRAAYAQAQIVPEDEVAGATAKDVKGWNPFLGLNGSVNLVSNSNVVGQVEGLSMLFGLGVTGGADWVSGSHVLRNTLSINEGFAKTPVVDAIVKTNDVVALQSDYNYFLTRTLGAFARAEISTALFDSKVITEGDTQYRLLPGTPTGAPETLATNRLKTSSAFKPFTMNESFGLFAQPFASELITIRGRAGFGGRHTIADGVFVRADDDATPEVEFQELANVHQAGVEGFVGLGGRAKGGRLTYEAGASIMVPFINNDKYDRGAKDLTRLGLVAKASVGVFDWMAVVYQLALTVDPQLFPRDEELTQLQNSILLTFQYNILDKEEAPSGPSELDEMKAAKEAAVKAAQEANARAEKLEAEVKALKKAAPNEAPNEEPNEE